MMDDHEIHNCIDAKNKQMIDTVTKVIDGYTTSIVTLITAENINIKKSIDQLTERVGKQNHRVDRAEAKIVELEVWQSGHIGETMGASVVQSKHNINWSKTFNVVMAVIGLTALLYTAYNSRESKMEARTSGEKIDNLGSPVVVNGRGEVVDLPKDYKLKMWPNDFDSTKLQYNEREN